VTGVREGVTHFWRMSPIPINERAFKWLDFFLNFSVDSSYLLSGSGASLIALLSKYSAVVFRAGMA
jgi:hypothetical protein